MIRIREDIKQAIADNKPVVALESTIISHGMPYPENVKTAIHCQDIIEAYGVQAATIAIIAGEIVVGLDDDEIEYIADPKTEVLKVGRKDIPVAIERKMNGALTVSATMAVCQMAGIRFFATGGIGGVHRGASETFDISSDLEEFTKSQVAVVSAGAKAILDLEKTMEYLETKGVLVLGYQTNELPAFYSRESGLRLEYRCDDPEEIAGICRTKWGLGFEGGVFVANPIPKEYSYPVEEINKAIDQAVEEMNERGIKGKATTPYLLKRISEITGNKSLKVNMELVFNNCDLAARIAKYYWGE